MVIVTRSNLIIFIQSKEKKEKEEIEKEEVGKEEIIEIIENSKDEEIEIKAEGVKEVNEDNPKPEKVTEEYTADDFQKSRNSKTAALFQKHGKLLDDPISSKDKKEETESKNSCWSCLFCFTATLQMAWHNLAGYCAAADALPASKYTCSCVRTKGHYKPLAKMQVVFI